MEGLIGIVFMIIGLLILYYVIQAAVTKGNKSVVGRLLEGKEENLSINELFNKYRKI